MVVAIAWSVFATSGEPFSTARLLLVALTGLAVIAAAAGARARHPLPAPTVASGAVAIWVALIGAVVAFQLANFLHHPRQTYPTISSLLNLVLDSHPLRAGGFALWLALGWYLLRRR